MELLTAGQMQKADRKAIVDMRIPSLKLMEKAGGAVAREARRVNAARKPVAILCGKGNNGGDGLVAARILHRRGFKVTVFLTSESFSKDADVQFKRLPRAVCVVRAHSQTMWNKEKEKIRPCGLLIDALFGTGLSHPLKGLYRKIVEDLLKMPIPSLSVDIPSGIDATNGRILGAAVLAQSTVTFCRPKIGHVLYPGAARCGKLIVADIGISDHAVASTHPDTFLMDQAEAARILPPRKENSHKGTYGRSVVLAGSRGMTGAAVLAAEAALRIGSGLTHLVVPESIYTIAARKVSPEVMCGAAPDAKKGVFGVGVKSILPFLDRASCVLLGPGIGRAPRTMLWVATILKSLAGKKKLILDADALHAVAAGSFMFKGEIAITPHAGEMAKLTGQSRTHVESNPVDCARAYAKKHALTVVLKGSRTVIAGPDGSVTINVTGNSALAKGATGDVLAGLICGLCAQGLTVFDASRLAVYLHGRAADIAVNRGRDKRTFLASDIFTYLDPALLELSD